MAVRTNEEIMGLVKGLLGDRADDDTVSFLEDLTDTLNTRFHDEEDWKKKYEDNDAEWRRRYTSRFFDVGGADTDETIIISEETEIDVPADPMSYEDLFKEE